MMFLKHGKYFRLDFCQFKQKMSHCYSHSTSAHRSIDKFVDIDLIEDLLVRNKLCDCFRSLNSFRTFNLSIHVCYTLA
jgi:hypothetical protein